LIDKGIIPTRYLYTIRKGELAAENVKGSLHYVATDIIKIKGKDSRWVCHFYDHGQKKCTIYENRPSECRALKCWDTTDLEKMYQDNRLTREDLLKPIKGLWDLILDHQLRCSYKRLKDLATEYHEYQNNKSAEAEILEIIQYDKSLRELVVEKGNVETDMTDFLFGRPLYKTIHMFNLELVKKGNQTHLNKISRKSDET